MRLGILADIHANREALDACLARFEREDIDRLVILGDVVGYGADPAYCVDRVMEFAAAGAIVVRGNHDQAVLDTREGMNDVARTAMVWTRTQLDGAQTAYLTGLPLTVSLVDVLITHANGWAPGDFGYIQTTRDAERSLQATNAHLTLCGHTHVPALYHAVPMRPAQHFKPVNNVSIPLSGRLRWLAVIGAVGQPRAGSPNACCATYDVDQRRLTYLAVPYDVQEAARRVRAAGLPDVLAGRLLKGR
jgi:predicted phosphodiesterase